jgi:transposase-like protein
MDDLSRFCCQNPDCSNYGIRGESNLSVCDRYGKHKQYRLLYCNVCKARFSERKGTPFFQARLPTEKVVSVLEHIAQGCGVRKTERLVGVHRDTVTRYSRLAGEHASKAHDELVAFSPEDRRGPVR